MRTDADVAQLAQDRAGGDAQERLHFALQHHAGVARDAVLHRYAAAPITAASWAMPNRSNGRLRVSRASRPSTVLPTRFDTSICTTVARTARTASGVSTSSRGSGSTGRPASAQARAYVNTASSAL